MSKEPTRGLSIRINGHRYYAREWYTTKKEAQERATTLRSQSHIRSVRIVKRLADRRYARYWIFTR
jgi:hypothetical protein